MKDDKLDLYEYLIRTSLLLIFFVALSVGTFGLITISTMLIQQGAPRPEFVGREAPEASFNDTTSTPKV